MQECGMRWEKEPCFHLRVECRGGERCRGRDNPAVSWTRRTFTRLCSNGIPWSVLIIRLSVTAQLNTPTKVNHLIAEAERDNQMLLNNDVMEGPR